ncbi:MAG: chemotaxis protein CheA [Lachnospiraceae bacterium]|nr:chemotaxis protein CheA [Lachnospiraceae bacterium]
MSAEWNTEGMLDMYLFENSQLLEQLQDTVLEQKDAERFDDDAINEIFRAMHTIKGSSGVMMFDEITAVSHKLEDVFYYLRESKPENVPHLELVEHVLDVADFINGEMTKLSEGEAADGKADNLIKQIDDFLEKIKGGTKDEPEKVIAGNVYEEPTQFYIAPLQATSTHYYKVYITFTQGCELVNIHAYKTVYALKEVAEDMLYFPEDIMTGDGCAEEILKNGFKILIQTQKSEEDIRGLIGVGYDIEKVDIYECNYAEFKLGFETDTSAIQIDLDSPIEEIKKKADAPGDFVIREKGPGKVTTLAKDKPKKAEKNTFISVDVHKMDMLMDLIGELVISESVVLQNPDLKVPGLKLDNFNKAARRMTKISSDLQNVIMTMRMVPLTATFQKMNRIVFDVSRKLGKDVEFEMIGDTTEVDKNIIEHISDPLMHLVRNSVDHGIEMPDERERKGKTERGKVTLSAHTESGKVWISVKDNGGGLDRNKILAKARKQGLIEDYNKPDTAFKDKEVFQFITLPGFSTNEEVTEYSGRGVGMDVVVQNIQEIGGTLDIDSVAGEGSTMTIKIPLTLAIIDGIVMKAGGTAFAIQTGVVKEFLSTRDTRIVKEPSGEECVMIRGDALPVLRLGSWYHLPDYVPDDENGMMIIFAIEEKRVCLFVDELIGKQEIVVKPIPSYVKKVRGLTGCTQLGDGSIALILDPAGLAE